MATKILKCFGENARQISPAVVNLFQANNNVDSLEFQIENYNQDNVNLSTLDPYAICHGDEFIGGLDEVKLTSEVTSDGILRVYWDLTIMSLNVPQTITAQLVFKNDEGAVWTSYKMILFCNESLTADEEIVAQYPTILKQMEKRIDDKTDEATQGAVDDITNTVASQVDDAIDAINQMAGNFDAGVIYIPYGEHILPEYRIENRLYYQYTNGEHTQGRFEDYMGNVLVAEGSGGGGSGLPMFAHIWSDHLYNDASYLRADTFSWHNASIYVTGYDMLLKEYNSEKCVEKTENGVTYRLTPNGFKIASADQHDNVRYAFEQTDSAWFYILDTENGRFKLPREKAELVTNYPSTASVDVAVVGNGTSLGFSYNDVTYSANTVSASGITDVGVGLDNAEFSQVPVGSLLGITTDPTKSGLEGSGTADLSKITTERVNTEVKKYLYFYVGDYERPETEVNIGRMSEVLNDLEPLPNEVLRKNQITNCITEIPQRFKYTLENGTLTIKAGSVVTVPYGTINKTSEFPVGATFLNDNFKVVDTQYADGKFFVWVELVNDIANGATTTSTDGGALFSVNILLNDVGASWTHTSGDGGTTKASYHYDTSENKITYYENGTSQQNYLFSLPLGIAKADGTHMFGSITQIFQGMGYIGGTNYILSGVKFLIAKGYNSDGSYKNQEYTINKVMVSFNNFSDGSIMFFRNFGADSYQVYNVPDVQFLGELSSVPPISDRFEWYYNKTERLWYAHEANETSWVQIDYANIGINSTGETKFKEVFRAVDYSDKATVAGWSFPSNKYIDLTLNASGSTYTAPADGWFVLAKGINSNGQFGTLHNITSGLCISNSVTTAGWNGFVPAKKGDVIKVHYNLGGDTGWFRFVYAEGSK